MKIQCSFPSKQLNRTVQYILILPDKGIDPDTKCIMFLHGINDCMEDWLLNSPVLPLFRNKNAALIFPNGENSFYVDHAGYVNYGVYFGEELVQHLISVYHLPADRNNWRIAGYSMGGFGALRTGWKYAQNFSKIAAFSSALVADNAVKSTEDAMFVIEKRSFFASVFGDLDHLKESDKDPEYLIKERLKEGVQIPMYLACGTEDFLLRENRKFHQFLNDNDIGHIYEERPGTHNWTFWSDAIEKAAEWLMED